MKWILFSLCFAAALFADKNPTQYVLGYSYGDSYYSHSSLTIYPPGTVKITETTSGKNQTQTITLNPTEYEKLVSLMSRAVGHKTTQLWDQACPHCYSGSLQIHEGNSTLPDVLQRISVSEPHRATLMYMEIGETRAILDFVKRFVRNKMPLVYY